MIGRAAARIEPAHKRLWQSLWGSLDINARQKWVIVWPLLRQLPPDNVSLLDVGCGPGDWVIEIAARRPRWKVTGIDLDGDAIKKGEALRKKLGLSNLQLVEGDFLDFRPDKPFDAVMSVASAHYPFEHGRGEELFQQFYNWLQPQGRLFLYAARRCTESPYTKWHRGRRWYNVFTADQLTDLCAEYGLVPEHLSPRIGTFGVMAKDLHRYTSHFGRLLRYPLVLALSRVDRTLTWTRPSRSLFWMLVARKPKPHVQNRTDILKSASRSKPIERTEAEVPPVNEFVTTNLTRELHADA